MLIPISKVDENMKRSQARDAITTQKFFFRTNIDTSCDESKGTSEPVIREMTLDQIMNGDGENFKGLIPILTEYLRDNEASARICIQQYINSGVSLFLRPNNRAG